MRLQPVCGVERVVAAPVAGEDVLVDLLVAGIDPALDRAGIHVRRKAERLVAGLTAADAVGIGALQVGIEDALVASTGGRGTRASRRASRPAAPCTCGFDQ